MRRVPILVVAGFLTVAGVALGATFVTGTYNGKSAQKRAITIQVSTIGMTSAQYRADYRCVVGRMHAPAFDQLTRLGSQAFRSPGHVDARFASLSGDDRVHFVFTVNRRRITGYFSETYTTARGATCKSGKVRFKLRH